MPAALTRSLPRRSAAWRREQTNGSFLLALGFELERDLELRAVRLDLAVLDLHVELRDLGNAEIAQRLAGAGHRGCGCLLPRFAARADQLDDFVDAFAHVVALG